MTDGIRSCGATDRAAVLAIVNRAAEAYRGVIPGDCWHEPYMAAAALDAEIDGGIAFTGLEMAGRLVGVMGIQRVRNVTLIRHAYVLPEMQGRGVGSALIRRLCGEARGQILVGTWAAAAWAIDFYERQGFRLVPGTAKDWLLATYWTISARQAEVSVVLASPSLDEAAADRLIEAAKAA